MPTKDNNTLKYSHREKSLKVPFTIYADLECLLIKQQSCQNNPNDSYTEKKLCVNLAATHYISLAHLIQNKTNTVFIEEETVSKTL